MSKGPQLSLSLWTKWGFSKVEVTMCSWVSEYQTYYGTWGPLKHIFQGQSSYYLHRTHLLFNKDDDKIRQLELFCLRSASRKKKKKHTCIYTKVVEVDKFL